MALYQPESKLKICGICACPCLDMDPITREIPVEALPEQSGQVIKRAINLRVVKPELQVLGGMAYICSVCAPTPDALVRFERLAKAAHARGMEDERQAVAAALLRYLPRDRPPTPSIRDMVF